MNRHQLSNLQLISYSNGGTIPMVTEGHKMFSVVQCSLLPVFAAQIQYFYCCWTKSYITQGNKDKNIKPTAMFTKTLAILVVNKNVRKNSKKLIKRTSLNRTLFIIQHSLTALSLISYLQQTVHRYCTVPCAERKFHYSSMPVTFCLPNTTSTLQKPLGAVIDTGLKSEMLR